MSNHGAKVINMELFMGKLVPEGYLYGHDKWIMGVMMYWGFMISF